jgi:hypothetical protein
LEPHQPHPEHQNGHPQQKEPVDQRPHNLGAQQPKGLKAGCRAHRQTPGNYSNEDAAYCRKGVKGIRNNRNRAVQRPMPSSTRKYTPVSPPDISRARILPSPAEGIMCPLWDEGE